jgi:hypothetical protein
LGAFKGGSTLSKLGQAGQVLSGYSQGAAQGREHEANLNLSMDQLRQRQVEADRIDAQNRAKLELDQRTTGQDLETQARRQAAWGTWLAQGPIQYNAPASVASRIPAQFTAPGPDFSQIGKDALRDAQQRLVSGSDKKFTPTPTIPSPPITPQPNESLTDKLMRYSGLVSGVLGAYGGYKPPTR